MTSAKGAVDASRGRCVFLAASAVSLLIGQAIAGAPPGYRNDALWVQMGPGSAARAREGKLVDRSSGARLVAQAGPIDLSALHWDAAIAAVPEPALGSFHARASINLARPIGDPRTLFTATAAPGVDVAWLAVVLTTVPGVERTGFVPLPMPPPVAPDFQPLQG